MPNTPLLLEHSTTLDGLKGILESQYIKTPKSLNIETHSSNFVFFRIVPKISEYGAPNIYLDINYINNPNGSSHIIHPTNNLFDTISKLPYGENCNCLWEYISPELAHELNYNPIENVNNHCMVDLNSAKELLTFDKEYCDGGNEVGFNKDIPIKYIKYIVLPPIPDPKKINKKNNPKITEQINKDTIKILHVKNLAENLHIDVKIGHNFGKKKRHSRKRRSRKRRSRKKK